MVKNILRHYQAESTLIFCNTKEQTVSVTSLLNKDGFNAKALNGDMEQLDRDIAMILFGNQSTSILVATDVAARGLDIKDLPLVINYDIAFEQDVHIHRVGRTGRAGSKGVAISLSLPADAERLCLIESDLGHPLSFQKAEQLKPNGMPSEAKMMTLCLNAGKKDKIRPGVILGALTKDAGFPGDKIGKINVAATYSYVALDQSIADKALKYFQTGSLKGRRVLVRQQR